MWAWIASGGVAGSIVGGAPVVSEMDPVVAVIGGGAVICSGTLLHPEWVLTAGHCVDRDPTEIWWGADLRDGAPALRIGVRESLVHPERDGRSYDVGLIRLERPSTGAVAILGEQAPQLDDVLTAWGFGATADGADDAGVKRAVDLDVIDVQPVVLTTYRGGGNLCSGDSGGPLARLGSTPLEIVGVASFVDPTCLGGAGGGTRADVLSGFVEQHVPPLELPEAPDTGGGAPARRGSGCRTVRQGEGWIAILSALSLVWRPGPRRSRGNCSATSGTIGVFP